MIWLGSKRGYLSDWITQRWVQLTGRRVNLRIDPWLNGPIAPTKGITPDYFESFAKGQALHLRSSENAAGVIADFTSLHGPSFDSTQVHPTVVHFYEHTSLYDLDAWAQWCGIFRPFGWLLAKLFSRRLQQLNIPLSGLDTSRGVTSEILQFIDEESHMPRHTAWFRKLRGSGNVLYAGFYSSCVLPTRSDPCVKVVFPLPNGNAIVIMRTESRPDGSFVVTSAGSRYGEPGFYFTVYGNSGVTSARYVKALRESIHVFPAEDGLLRADHVLTLFGFTFLRLHYRMRRRQVNSSA